MAQQVLYKRYTYIEFPPNRILYSDRAFQPVSGISQYRRVNVTLFIYLVCTVVCKRCVLMSLNSRLVSDFLLLTITTIQSENWF
uniref:Uncharacterized protein n=1 Tax=Pararge aegeria TaxID=116150 RepID=S4P708_9NEOP